MKRTLSVITLALVICTLAMFGSVRTADAKSTKHITITKISNTKLYYHKSGGPSDIIKNPEWENIIGLGKQKTIRISSKCKYYLYNSTKMKPYKTSKVKFHKEVKKFGSSLEQESNGAKWYWEMAAKITISNNKVIKIVQEYQA